MGRSGQPGVLLDKLLELKTLVGQWDGAEARLGEAEVFQFKMK